MICTYQRVCSCPVQYFRSNRKSHHRKTFLLQSSKPKISALYLFFVLFFKQKAPYELECSCSLLVFCISTLFIVSSLYLSPVFLLQDEHQ